MPYMVVRGDDNGQNFVVEQGLDEAAAIALYERLLRGHKQWYRVFGYASDRERSELIAFHDLRL